MKFVGASFPTTNLSRGDTFLNTATGAIYEFVEGDPLSATSWRIVGGNLSNDPDTSEWGVNQKGARWFNTTEQQEKMWDGTNIVSLVSSI